MPQPNDFMKSTTDGADAFTYPPEIPTDRPTAARMYGIPLGSKDNFEVDREAVAALAARFPEGIDIARQNRLFLYRAVRFLTQEVGITQFLDLGSGLPSDQNVHEVAQEFQPKARVVYVDNDPIVLAHGRALLADDASTVVLSGDLTDTDAIVAHPEIHELIDFSQPVGVLMLSIPHLIPDDDTARRAVQEPMNHVPSGSYLALTHMVAATPELQDLSTRSVGEYGLGWKTRAPGDVDSWVTHLAPVSPGLCDIADWRPDPDQPPLPEAHPSINQHIGASATTKRSFEYGGVLRKP